MREDDLNLTNPSFFAGGDPHAIFARLRREDPIHWTEGALNRGFWSVTRLADIKTVFLNDNRVFSVQRFGAALPQNAELEDPETSYFLKLLRTGAQLSVMDGQPHAHLRKVFADRFSVPGVGGIEGVVRRCIDQIFDRVAERGACDFTVDMAGRLPLMVIADMMAIPDEDAEQLYRWNNMVAAPEDPEWSLGGALETSTAGVTGIMRYLTAMAHDRRRRPADDLMSQLALAEIDGVRLTDDQLGFNGLMFFGAGHETTRAALSAGLLELIRAPDQFEALRRDRFDPKALAAAGEEMVRWASPLTHTLRTATEDFELAGARIREGDWVVPWFISANRDETAFVDADRFDIRRSPNNHLGFAAGKHFCLGAHLARLEMRLMLEAILDRMENIELTGAVEMAASNLFWGIKHLPIRFNSRAGSADGARAAA